MSEVSSGTLASTAGHRKSVRWFDRLDAVVLVSSIRLAFRLDRFAPLLGDALTDGIWAGAWPVVAAVVPLLAFAVGLLGVGHWPGIVERFYITSLSFMIVAIVGAILSGTAGVTFLAGYIVGDILGNPFVRRAGFGSFGRTPLSFRTHETVALRDLRILGLLLIIYMVLALLVIVVPQVSRKMAKDVADRVPTGSAFRLVAWIGLYVAACGFFAYLWARAAVPLIRPLETFRGDQSIPQYFQAPLFDGWRWLAAAAMLAAVVRVALENRAERSPRARVIAKLQQWRSTAQDRGAFWAALPGPIRIAVVSIVTAFLFSGIASGWFDFLLTALSVALILVLRFGLSASASWTSLVAKTSVALRFIVAFVAGSWLVEEWMSHAPNPWRISFRAILVGVLLMLAIFSVLFPSRAGAVERREASA